MTLYAVVLFSLQCHGAERWKRSRRLIWRFCLAVKHSARSFLDASLIFALAMLIAATYTLANRVANPRAPLKAYAMQLTMYLAHLTLLPALILHHCNVRSLRRRRGRSLLWCLAGGLQIVTVGCLVRIKYDKGWETSLEGTWTNYHDPDQRLPWGSWCSDLAATARFKWWSLSLSSFVGLTMVLGVSFLRALRNFPETQARFRKTCILIYLVATWIFLFKFTVYRNTSKKRAGASNKDTEWSFGQILGLTSWVPVIVDLGYI